MLTQVKEWSERPFNPEMGIWGWVFFIGLLLIVSGLWASVIRLINRV